MRWISDNIEKYFPAGSTGRFSRAYKWFLPVLVVFAVYYLLVIVILPVARYQFLFPEQQRGGKNSLKHDFSSYYSVSDSLIDQSIDLANKEAFLLASLEMAKDEEIALELNLPDSTLSLLIQGLPVHTAAVAGYKYSRILKESDPFLTAGFFSYPFKVMNYTSSVPKIPVIVRKAPKDTTEASVLPEPERLEESNQYVSYKLKLDRKLDLVFEQDSISDLIDKRTIRQYLRRERKGKRRAVRQAFIRAGSYEYIPEIKIRLRRDDALVFFRALPENGEITIRLNDYK